MKPAVKGILIGCGASALIFVVVMVACAGFLLSGPESGVKLPYEMDAYATNYLEEHKLLEPGEELVMYYDSTLSMDGSEAAILTNRRVLYHHEGKTEAIAISEIKSIRELHNGPMGVEIAVESKSGQTIRIDIPPLNGGELFEGELKSRWEETKGK